MSTNRNREEFGPVTRNRSSSANEASKPILVLQRHQSSAASKTLNFSPSNGGNAVVGKFFDSIFIDSRIRQKQYTISNQRTQTHFMTSNLFFFSLHFTFLLLFCFPHTPPSNANNIPLMNSFSLFDT